VKQSITFSQTKERYANEAHVVMSHNIASSPLKEVVGDGVCYDGADTSNPGGGNHALAANELDKVGCVIEVTCDFCYRVAERL
jgi:hypothetical protein